jgi:ketosteroid isomerase-like protein
VYGIRDEVDIDFLSEAGSSCGDLLSSTTRPDQIDQHCICRNFCSRFVRPKGWRLTGLGLPLWCKDDKMHDSTILLQRLFTGLIQHDHQSMADCYHPEGAFAGIAFDLHGKTQIHAMWHMICEGDIQASFDVVSADHNMGQVSLVDDYTFTSTGRKVHNVIDSHFSFRDGRIIEHRDFCDARAWANMALGGARGFFAGRLHFLRSYKARKMLEAFIAQHPEYR